jgi:predicted O-methyltransferase YrrM
LLAVPIVSVSTRNAFSPRIGAADIGQIDRCLHIELPIEHANQRLGDTMSPTSNACAAWRSCGILPLMRRSLLPADVELYVSKEITRESPLQGRLRTETAALPMGMMQISADQGALLALLVRTIGARRAIEIGTFTGYSALAVASALPADGKLICCDISDEWTRIGRRYWDEAGVAQRIDLRLGPALATLDALMHEAGTGTFDFAFIDADKGNYDAYYEACLKLVREGGLIALDNMLWGGQVVEADAHDADTDALRALNAKIRDDKRVDACLLTVGDGVMLARKR